MVKFLVYLNRHVFVMFYWEYTVIKTTVWENQFWNKTEVPVIFIILCYIKSKLAQASTFTLRKTFLFKYTENFTTTTKKEKNQIKILIFFSFLLKTYIEAVLTSTHNLCLWAEIRKNNVYPCKLQFYHIKVGCKRVKIIQSCFHNEVIWERQHLKIYLMTYILQQQQQQ